MKKSALHYALLYLLITVIALVSAFPILWMLSTSLKPSNQIYTSPPRLISEKGLTVEHFAQVIGDKRVIRYFFNSIVITISATLLGLLVGFSAGYGFSRFTFIGKRLLMVSVLISRMIPRIVLAIPLYVLLTQIGFINSIPSVVMVYLIISLPLASWLMKTFFDKIPKELDDAALIDGCNRFTTLVRVILPLSLPGIFSVGMYIFISTWTEFLLGLIMTSSFMTRPLTVGLMYYMEEYGVEWGALMSASILLSVPVIVVFLIFHKYLIRGLSEGAVKG